MDFIALASSLVQIPGTGCQATSKACPTPRYRTLKNHFVSVVSLVAQIMEIAWCQQQEAFETIGIMLPPGQQCLGLESTACAIDGGELNQLLDIS